MSLRTVLVVAMALVSGVSAVVGINTLRNQGSGEPGDKVPVVVALAEVPRGRILTSDLVRTRDYPKDLVPEGAITRAEEAIDRTVVMPLAKDEPLLDAKLASRTAGRGLAPLVPPGMRACTITTNVASSVAGFILPGNRVDVLLTISDTNRSGFAMGPAVNYDATGGGSTTTLLQNVEILAVDQRVEAPADNKVDPNLRSVTLLVTQAQAAKLALGQNKGTLQLTLRNPEDNQPARVTPATLADIQFSQGLPWEERLKGVLEAAGKVMAARQAPPPPAAPAAKPAAESVAPAWIRTVRGAQEGAVYVGRAGAEGR
jgi:pilus assembly protein CpaB